MPRPVKTASSPDLRDAIARVAEALFAERGFDGASIRDIAQRAGVTKALVYHYYRSKEELYLSLLEAAVSGVTTQIEHIAAGPDSPERKLRKVVRIFLAAYDASPQRFLLVQRAVDEFRVAALTLAERWFSRVYRAVQTVAEEGIQCGAFKLIPSQLVPFIVVGLVLHALRTHTLQDRITPGFSAQQLLTALEDLIFTLLKAETREGLTRAAKKRTKRQKRQAPTLKEKARLTLRRTPYARST